MDSVLRFGIIVFVFILVSGCKDSDTVPNTDTLPDSGVDIDSSVEMESERETVSYCDGALNGFELFNDPVARGPWIVASRNVQVAGMEAEVWYPALPASAEGEKKYIYNLAKHLSDEQQATLTDPNAFVQHCDCYRALPIDDQHGPYPVVIFLHSIYGFSTQSLELMVHWSSRGFVVIALDTPNFGLKGMLSGDAPVFETVDTCNAEGKGPNTTEARMLISALKETPLAEDLVFLDGYIDVSRLAVAGHGSGGTGAKYLSSEQGVQVIVLLGTRDVCPSQSLRSLLMIGAMQSIVHPYGTWGYDASPPPKRLVGLANTGETAFTSFCSIGENAGGIIAAAQNAGATFDPRIVFGFTDLEIDDCQKYSSSTERSREVINYATSAVLEQILLCLPERAEALENLPMRFPDAVGEYQEQLN